MHLRDGWVDDSPVLHLGALSTPTRSQNIAADERPHSFFQKLCSQAEFSETVLAEATEWSVIQSLG